MAFSSISFSVHFTSEQDDVITTYDASKSLEKIQKWLLL